MKKKENYLDKIPCRNGEIKWETDDSGIVTMLVENKGFFNKIAQKFFGRPEISYIHLDELGSFIWKLIDGETTIAGMGKAVDEKFGEAAHPLYERLAKYIQILESYKFVEFKENL